MNVERDDVVLTVPEGKRLIGMAVAALPAVQRAMKDGTIGIARGTTNGYVAEAILGREIDRTAFVTGVTLPEGRSMRQMRGDRELGEIVLERGILVAGKTLSQAVRGMGPDDVLIKGANALNYRQHIAGILIANPAGGTTGGVIGHIIGRHITFIIPVSLEKEIPADIMEMSRRVHESSTPGGYALWPVTGQIVTEIEAFSILAGVKAFPVAAGGVGGAEGSVRLLLEGTEESMETAATLLQQIHGEPSFDEVAKLTHAVRNRR